ncbi:MAG: hypothetical protein JXM70_02690, partial [Pirellulales bacterium]|nr:hypothetical protein [Pirellulales bacterium]
RTINQQPGGSGRISAIVPSASTIPENIFMASSVIALIYHTNPKRKRREWQGEGHFSLRLPFALSVLSLS